MEGLPKWLKLLRSLPRRSPLRRSRLRRRQRRSKAFDLEYTTLTVPSHHVTAGLLIAILLSSSAAQSASITNRDDVDRKVTIIEGSSPKSQILKPNEAIRGVCKEGCLVRIDDSRDDPFELEGSDVTSIEDGQLYDDETVAPPASGTGSADQPSQPGSRP